MRNSFLVTLVFSCLWALARTDGYAGSAYSNGNLLKSSYQVQPDGEESSFDADSRYNTDSDSSEARPKPFRRPSLNKYRSKHDPYRKKTFYRKYQPAYVYSKYVRPTNREYRPVNMQRPVYKSYLNENEDKYYSGGDFLFLISYKKVDWKLLFNFGLIE